MPIRPENKARYPANWAAISAEARERAGNRCQWVDGERRCSARQYAVGSWGRNGGGLWAFSPIGGNAVCDMAGGGNLPFAEAKEVAEANNGYGERYIVIVLTVAHLDHTPENVDRANLRAWCQRHHLAYDHEHHRATAQATRRARSGMADLFGGFPEAVPA